MGVIKNKLNDYTQLFFFYLFLFLLFLLIAFAGHFCSSVKRKEKNLFLVWASFETDAFWGRRSLVSLKEKKKKQIIDPTPL